MTMSSNITFKLKEGFLGKPYKLVLIRHGDPVRGHNYFEVVRGRLHESECEWCISLYRRIRSRRGNGNYNIYGTDFDEDDM